MSHEAPSDPAQDTPPRAARGTLESLPFEDTLRAIESEFDTVLGRPDQVAASCRILRQEFERFPVPASLGCLLRLVPLLHRRQGPMAQALFHFLEEQASGFPDPQPLALGMLQARDANVRLGSVKMVLDLVEGHRLGVSMEVARALGQAMETGDGLECDARVLEALHDVLRELPSPEGTGHAGEPAVAVEGLPEGGEDPVVALWAEATPPSLRSLAARLLDRDGELVPDARAVRFLGEEAFAFMAPYLSFTRATHRDLLHLVPNPGEISPGFQSLRAAEALLGSKLLGDVIGRLGWSRVTWGLEVRPTLGVTVEEGWPFLVGSSEADLLLACEGARRLWKRFLVVVHGGSPGEAGAAGVEGRAIERFRRYNVAHSEVLAELMEVAPLTVSKVRRILEKMEGIVGDFVGLFAGGTDDASRLPTVFGALRRAVQEAMGEGAADQALSPEVTRLVQMFEDPERLDDVRTVHGLKRYLHQRGLRLAFRLFRSGRATNRFVDLVLTSQHQVLEVVQKIRYIEFEPEPGRDPAKPPFTVALLAEALGRQLAYGQKRFPDIEVLGYGTEVQIFIRFRNHPVFLRIDLSPPLRGGMIDLEYFGVSQYEMGHHPDLTLSGIRRLFRRLDFDVNVEGFRLHVRYDKERALDLGDLLEKMGVLFPLLPYLMDFDWIVGGLDYRGPEKESVTDAWAEFLLRWGVLPADALLTSDRRKVLLGIKPDPAGNREIPWDGRGPYRDRFTGLPPDGFWDGLRGELEDWGLRQVARWDSVSGARPGQIPLERAVLKPLRQAVARGEARAGSVGLSLASPDLFTRDHPANRFAELLAGGEPDSRDAAGMAALVGSIERHLRFQMMGSVNGHPVQQAVLPLQGGRITLFVLRDPRGIGRLALATEGDALHRRRAGTGAVWEAGGDIRCDELARRLRGNNYLASDFDPVVLLGEGEAEAAASELRLPNPIPPTRPLPGDRIIPGLAAAPGRSAGFAWFPSGHHAPQATEILFAPAVRPEDAPLLRQVAGIVSTGGGALSHAGLVALELGKPALIVPGRWEGESDGSMRFIYRRPVFREEEDSVAGFPVVRRLDLREEEEALRGGDLVVVDADGQCLTVLGSGRDALAVQQELHHLADTADRLAQAGEGTETLVLRGRLLRTSHQLQKLLTRITDPALARHAVRQLLEGGANRYSPARQIRRTLLEALFANPSCGDAGREAACLLARELASRRAALSSAAADALATSRDAFEILFHRREVLRVESTLVEVRALLGEDAVPDRASRDASGTPPAMDRLARKRLETLRDAYWARATEEEGRPDRIWVQAHSLDGIERIQRILGTPFPQGKRSRFGAMGEKLDRWRSETVEGLSTRNIVTPGDGGRELSPLVGAKAANLGEVARALGGERVPPWFALTDRAFRIALGSGLADRGGEAGVGAPQGPALGRTIDETLARDDLDAARKSALIRDLWRKARLPEELVDEITVAYRLLSTGDEGPADGSEPEGPFVAIRSSTFEEDTERGAWAGAFDTFLFVRGRDALLELLKLAWAGLWTERAIRLRRVREDGAQPCGGGLVVQRMVPSRVSGVVHTVSTATRQLRDLVINAGLGLGEGVVSGMVEVDHILVSKEGDLHHDPLRFQYRVGDKREQVLFDASSGQGTRRVETLYHQRLRPALEYVELCDLVRTAAVLEELYGHPLDMEFAIQGQVLLVLQVRPIPLFHSLTAETLERFPFSDGAGEDSEAQA